MPTLPPKGQPPLTKVYIASPYTIGDTAVNVRRQIKVADQLITLGFVPFVPLLCHFQHLVFPRSYDSWLIQDLEWLRSCDALLRLGGPSKGADLEETFAAELDLYIFYSVQNLVRYYHA